MVTVYGVFTAAVHFRTCTTLLATSINQSKFIFQVITEIYNVINAVALEGLPEKHYAHLDWSPEQKNNTSIKTSEKNIAFNHSIIHHRGRFHYFGKQTHFLFIYDM